MMKNVIVLLINRTLIYTEMNTIYVVMQVHYSDFNIICNIVFSDFTSVLIHIVHANIKYLLIYLAFVIYIYIYIYQNVHTHFIYIYIMCMNILVFILYFQPVAFIV